jgi:hypothetical protein
MEPAPKRLRFVPDADGRGGRIPPSKAVSAALAFAVIWNLVLPHVFAKSNAMFTTVGIVAAVVFGLFFLRSIFRSTRLRFERGKLVCASTLPTKRFEHLVADIDRFASGPSRSARYDTHRLWLVTKSGAQIELPCDFDGLVLTAKGSRHALTGLARIEDLEWIARMLNDALEEARREGHEYRIADVVPEEIAEEGDDDARSRNTR